MEAVTLLRACRCKTWSNSSSSVVGFMVTWIRTWRAFLTRLALSLPLAVTPGWPEEFRCGLGAMVLTRVHSWELHRVQSPCDGASLLRMRIVHLQQLVLEHS